MSPRPPFGRGHAVLRPSRGTLAQREAEGTSAVRGPGRREIPRRRPESDAGDPDHFLEGGGPFGELAQGGLAEGAHAVLDRLALDLGGVGAAHDQRLDGVVDGQDLENAGAAEVAGAAALEAPFTLLDLDAFAGGDRQAQ